MRIAEIISKRAWPVLLAALMVVAGCSGGDTLQGAFEKLMKEDGADGFDLLHLQENEQDGLVLFTSWTSDYPAKRDEPAMFYFQKQDGRWAHQTGTACSQSGVSRLGLMGNGYLYCATLRDGMDFESVRVGDSEAKMFQTNGGRTVWYVVAADGSQTAFGITVDGHEAALN